MQQDVYVDLLFLINFSMDYLCLYICAKVLHRKLRIIRLIISSALGGLYSVVSLFINTDRLLELALDIIICIVMCIIVFSEKGRRMRSTFLCSFLFVGISMMTGGCMTAIFNILNKIELPLANITADGISAYLFAILAAISGILSLKSGKLISQHASIRDCTLYVTLNGKQTDLLALSDTGNLVKDPITGKNVIIIERNSFSKIADIRVFDEYVRGNLPPPNDLPPIRLIPINTASGNGLLAALKPDKIIAEIHSKKQGTEKIELDALIAPSDIKNNSEGYNAIIPAEILKI